MPAAAKGQTRSAARGASLLVAVVAAFLSAGSLEAARPLATPPDGAQTAQIRNGELVFSSVAVRNGFFELYLMRPDGTKLRRITKGRGWERFPKWSPDGRWIAYISDRSRPGNDGAFEIYVVRPNGTGFRRVTRDRWVDDQLGWAPDGKRFVLVSNRPSGRFGIWTANANGSGFRRLTRSGATPAWSPGDGTIAFESAGRSGSQEIWLMNTDGSNQRRLTEPPHAGDSYARDVMPDWSPGGEQIAFARRYRGRMDINVIRPDGTGLRRLTRQAGLHSWPAWSPDGKRIVFVTALGRRRSIYVMNADGTSQKRLRTGAVEYAYLDWQPLR